MKQVLQNLKDIIERRDKLQEQGKSYHPDTPVELKNAIDTFFIHCKNMIEYELDFMPGEALADLVEVIAKYTKYQHIAGDLVETLNNDYNMTV